MDDRIVSRERLNAVFTAGLLLFGFTLPLSKSAGNILLFLGYLVAAAGVAFYKDLRTSVVSSLRQPLTAAFALCFIVALIGVLFTEKYADGFRVANKFISLPMIYLLVSVLIEMVHDPEKRLQSAEKVLISFLLGLMVLNGIGIMTFFGVVGDKKLLLPLAPLNMHHIWFSNINALGIYTSVSLMLFSQRGKSARGKSFLFLFIALSVLCILLSQSRTAWFGIVLTSAIMTYFVSKNHKVFFIVAVSAAVVCGFAYRYVPMIHDRIDLISWDIAQFAAGETSTSLGGRFLMWKAALLMFLNNPLIGVGTGDYVPTMIAYVKSGKFPEFLLTFNQPHNMYLFALATNGILGLAALLSLFYRGMKFSIPLFKGGEGERLFGFLALATTVHYLIAGLTDSFFNIQTLRYAFALIMGVCIRKSLGQVHRG